MVKNGTITTYTYNLNNQLVSETTGGVTSNYTYDLDGNLLNVKVNGVIQKAYVYDAWGRLITYTDPN